MTDAANPLQEPNSAPGCRILVVDDNLDAAESLAMVLRLMNNDVQIAFDGPQAIAAAISYQPEIIFLDIGLPGMDGYEVALQLRSMKEIQTTRIIALTGWDQPEDRQRCAEVGFDQHLIKPVAPALIDKLVSSLRHPKPSFPTTP